MLVGLPRRRRGTFKRFLWAPMKRVKVSSKRERVCHANRMTMALGSGDSLSHHSLRLVRIPEKKKHSSQMRATEHRAVHVKRGLNDCRIVNSYRLFEVIAGGGEFAEVALAQPYQPMS